MMRVLFVAGLLLSAIASATAQTTLRVGDQKGNSQAVMQSAGVLKDVPYKIEWKEFPAAAPLLEALGAGAIDTGLVGDAPFTFAAAADVPVKAIGTIRQSRDGLAILVISSDLPEVLTISDRILVMRAGRLAGEISFDDATEERIMSLAALEHADPAHPEIKPTGFVS